MAWCDVVEPCTLRECRIALGKSQRRLRSCSVCPPSRTERGMPVDGRRRRRSLYERVRWRRIATTTISFRYPCWRSWSACTSRRCGRRRGTGGLPVTHDTKTTFRRLRARATLAAATQFRRAYYGRPVRLADRRQPADVGERSRRLRCADSRASSRARMSQAQLAHAGWGGAQGRRLPMGDAEAGAFPVFWQRLVQVGRRATTRISQYGRGRRDQHRIMRLRIVRADRWAVDESPTAQLGR